MIWEVRCIPGNLIGVGSTPQEALQKAIRLIEWTKSEEASFEDWYRQQWSYADAADVAMFDSVIATSARSLNRPREIAPQVAYDMVPTCA